MNSNDQNAELMYLKAEQILKLDEWVSILLRTKQTFASLLTLVEYNKQ